MCCPVFGHACRKLGRCADAAGRSVARIACVLSRGNQRSLRHRECRTSLRALAGANAVSTRRFAAAAAAAETFVALFIVRVLYDPPQPIGLPLHRRYEGGGPQVSGRMAHAFGRGETSNLGPMRTRTHRRDVRGAHRGSGLADRSDERRRLRRELHVAVSGGRLPAPLRADRTRARIALRDLVRRHGVGRADAVRRRLRPGAAIVPARGTERISSSPRRFLRASAARRSGWMPVRTG